MVIAGKMVLLANQGGQYAVTFTIFDGTNAPSYPLGYNTVYNYTEHAGALYTLGADRTIRCTTDLTTWTTVCSNAPAGSRSIAVLNGRLYCGTSNSTIHVYSAPVSTLPAVRVVPTKDFVSEQEPDPGLFTVKLDAMTTSNLTVNYTLSGTASNGVDYVSLPSSITITAGCDSATIPIAPVPDSLSEGPEYVRLFLAPDPAYSIETGPR